MLLGSGRSIRTRRAAGRGLVLVLAALSLAPRVRAAPPEPARSDAGTTALAQEESPAVPQQASPEVLASAAQAFDRGVLAHRDRAFELARIEFKRAYALVPDPRVLYNIGQVNQQLGYYVEALLAFERYLEQSGASLPAERRAETEQAIAKLKNRTARLTVTSNVPRAVVTIRGNAVGETPLVRLLVDAGRLEVTLTKDGYLATQRSVTLAGGDVSTLDVPLEPLAGTVVIQQRPQRPQRPERGWAAPERPSYSWVGWVATGVLTAAAVTTGTLMLLALNDRENLEKTVTSPDHAEAVERRARSFAIATDVLGAAALVAGGMSLYFTLDARPSRTAAPSAGATAGVRLSAVFHGTF